MKKYRKHYKPMGENIRIAIIPYSYGCTIKKLEEMIKIAENDFPSVNKEEIEIIQQGGNYCKGMYAIEFIIPSKTKIPEEYIEADMNPTI